MCYTLCCFCNQPLCPPPSSVQREQACAYHPLESTCAPYWGKRSLHCLHSTHSVHGCGWHASHHAVWGDPGVAPPRWQVAEHPLPSLRLAQHPLSLRDGKKDTERKVKLVLVTLFHCVGVIQCAHCDTTVCGITGATEHTSNHTQPHPSQQP